MRSLSILVVGILVLAVLAGPALAQSQDPPRAKYIPRPKDKILEEIRETSKKDQEARSKATKEIRDRQAERTKKERDERKTLRFDFDGVEKPASPDAFRPAFHFPPVAQYRTATCWAFSGTSFLESEVARLTGKKIKLSEIHTVYYEYLEKARRYILERGDSALGQGSECNAVVRMWKKYGAVPHEMYPGVLTEDGRHDHSRLFGEIRDYLQFVKAHDAWDEEGNLAAVRILLDKYLGEPPLSFEWEGRTVTPLEFVDEVLDIDLAEYVAVMSTLADPFGQKGIFDVPDNWWRSNEYHNKPLDEWYRILKFAVRNGYTVAIGGDVSEPGYNGAEDAAIVPPFDIPQEYINQDAREFRFYNRTTTDDHAIHIVGYTQVGDRDWFLVKDSARSARHGKHDGYLFYRDDYIRLKMLAFFVHEDALKGLVENP